MVDRSSEVDIQKMELRVGNFLVRQSTLYEVSRCPGAGVGYASHSYYFPIIG